jgi:hypothetical protein
MATTPNYSWVMPDPTDFVTDLPADFEIFGDAVDASLYALSPGTTAGDVDYYTSGTAKARLAIGTAGQVLQVNAGATAPEWATPASGGMTQLATGSLSGSSVVISSISGLYNNLQLVIRNFVPSTQASIIIRLNGDSGTNYMNETTGLGFNKTFNTTSLTANVDNATSGSNLTIFNLWDYANSVSIKLATTTAITQNSATPDFNLTKHRGAWNNTAAINSVSIVINTGTFSSGTYILYGVK